MRVHQIQLFDSTNIGAVTDEVAATDIRVLTWNIANPSYQRSEKQFDYLMRTNANVIILTELKNSRGSEYLYESFINAGFKVYFANPSQDNYYAVMIAEKGFNSYSEKLEFQFMPERCRLITLKTFLGDIKILGMYVPSRGPKEKRNVDKRRFQEEIYQMIKGMFIDKKIESFITGGDLNVIEPEHNPSYPFFGEWEYEFYRSFLDLGMIDAYKYLNPNNQEYSWFGRFNDGYRFDHLFISARLSKYVKECRYIHEPREKKLSDHSAMMVVLKSD